MNLTKYIKTGIIEKNRSKLNIKIIKVADSIYFENRHQTGYTQVSAISSLVSYFINPDIVISFGTAGGIKNNIVIGDVFMGDYCHFIDRIRLSSKKSFDLGIWGGTCIKN